MNTILSVSCKVLAVQMKRQDAGNLFVDSDQFANMQFEFQAISEDSSLLETLNPQIRIKLRHFVRFIAGWGLTSPTKRRMIRLKHRFRTVRALL